MTPKQKRVFDYITSVLKESEICPSYAEIMKALNISSKSIVAHYLNMLEKDGKIKIKKGRKRGIEVIDENAQLKTEYEKECRRADELEDSYWKSKKENQKLKELLKRCYSFIDWCELGVPVAQRPILMKDINQALGEDK